MDKFEEEQEPPPKKKKWTKKNNTNGKNYNTGRWSSEEHAMFLAAIELYGRDWKKVESYVKTRSSTQARSHAQKVLPHPSSEEAKAFNSESTTLSKSSPENRKFVDNNDDKKSSSVNSDENSSEFMVFKVEKVRRNNHYRSRVNSETQVITPLGVGTEFPNNNISITKSKFRKNSVNCDYDNRGIDLSGSPINECIKEQNNEDDEDEHRDDILPEFCLEKKKTFDDKLVDAFADHNRMCFLDNPVELNLEAPGSDFPMDVEEGIRPGNSINPIHNPIISNNEDVDMEDGSNLLDSVEMNPPEDSNILDLGDF